MTYEQKYGRPPDGFYYEEAPPEAWQFENPLVTVSKDGVVKNRLQKSFARSKAEPPKMRPISEILSREAEEMEFIKLDMDKQIKLVAEEHNRGAGPSEVRHKLGIKGAGTYYDRLDKARAMGLVADGVELEPEPVVVKEVVCAKSAPTITIENFVKLAEEKRAQAELLAESAERIETAFGIADDLQDLLGDAAGDLISALYEKVVS